MCGYENLTLKLVIGERLTRRQAAEFMGLHQDSVSRALSDGLAAAVLEWGGAGKAMSFSRVLVERWHHARTCRRHQGHQGRACLACWVRLENFKIFAEHLLDARHGAHESCGTGDNACGYPWAPTLSRRHTA